MKRTGHPKVDAIACLNIEGDVTPRSWYQHIFYKTKRNEVKVDRLAIDILSDILYWYRPYEKRDEITGHSLGWRKKFAEDKLRRSPEEFARSLNATTRCIRESMKVLESLGLITVINQPVKTAYGVLPNCMYIDVHPEAIERITYSTFVQPNSSAESIEKSLSTKWVTRSDEMGNKELRNRQQGVTKSSTLLYIENSAENPTETQERARDASCEFEILEPEPIHNLSTSPQPKPQHTVFVESDSFGQNVPAGEVVTTLVKINPESSAAKCDARFKAQYLGDDELQRYAEVWNEFRPKECMPAPKLDSRTKDRIRAIAKDYSLIDFSGAVCAIRECKAEGEYYRKEKFTLFRFLGEAHVTKMFATHCQYWETDRNYRERIEGKQESASDLPKYYDSKGNLLTGVWAEAAHLRATKPEFQKDRKRA